MTQVEEFEDLFTPLPGPTKVDWHGDDSLFVVFFGINDMVRLYPSTLLILLISSANLPGPDERMSTLT